MAYVDDATTVFDASVFCETITAAVGHTPHTCQLNLRNPSAVSDATAALQSFLDQSADPNAPDVVASYIGYSREAAELFNALRAISSSYIASNRNITSLALDCLFVIAHYSLQPDKPAIALQNARAVVKEIVKSRASQVYYVFIKDSRLVAKKSLRLLRLVAMCHPMFAKEIVNRFDLSSKFMAKSLCTTENGFCRVPFLDLVFTIVTTADRTLLTYLASSGRSLLFHCLKLILTRMRLEVEHGLRLESKFTNPKKEALNLKPLPSDLHYNGIDSGARAFKILPSTVQQRELTAAINILLAIEKHILTPDSTDRMQRNFLSDSILPLLAQIASTPMPNKNVSPVAVAYEQSDLRAAATRLFIYVSKDLRITSVHSVVQAINDARVNNNQFGKLVETVVMEQPLIAKELIESAVIPIEPALSSHFLSRAGLVSACIFRLQSPTKKLMETKMLEKCLTHEAPFIRHLGALFTIGLCKVIELSSIPSSELEDYIPSLMFVEKLLVEGKFHDDLGQKLHGCYQRLFDSSASGVELWHLKSSVEFAGDDISMAVDALESALQRSPYQTMRTAIHQRYLSKLIIQAAQERREQTAIKLWDLCADILRCTELFPHGTDHEVEIILAVLGFMSQSVEVCAKNFELLVDTAMGMPYGLYDRLSLGSNGGDVSACGSSLVMAAIVLRFQKLKLKQESGKASEDDLRLCFFLKRVVLTVSACETVMRSTTFLDGYLARTLPTIMNLEELWWSISEPTSSHPYLSKDLSKVFETTQRLLHGRGTYPFTKFMKSVNETTRLHKAVSTFIGHANQQSWTSVMAAEAWNTRMERDRSPPSRKNGCLLLRGTESYGTSLADDILSSLPKLILNYPRHLPANKIAEYLQRNLTEDDFVIALCILLQKKCSGSQWTELMTTSLEKMSRLIESTDFALSELLHRAMNVRLAGDVVWERRTVFALVRFLGFVLSKATGNEAAVPHFHLSLLTLRLLLLHSETQTCLLARSAASEEQLDYFPPLTSLPPETVILLLDVIPYFGAIRESVAQQFASWSTKQHRRCSGSLILLLGKLLMSENHQESKNVILRKKEKFWKRFVEGAAYSKAAWTDDSSIEDVAHFENVVNSLAKILVEHYHADKVISCMRHQFDQDKNFSDNLARLFCGILTVTSANDNEQTISNKSLTQLLTLTINWTKLQPSFGMKEGHTVVVKLVYLTAQRLRHRKAPTHSLIRNVKTVEKDLEVFCSSCFNSIHRLRTKFIDIEGNEEETFGKLDLSKVASLKLHLSCVGLLLSLDLNLHDASKTALFSLGLGNAGLLETILQTGPLLSAKSELRSLDSLLLEVSELVSHGLSQIKQSKDSDYLVSALISIENVLSKKEFYIGMSSSPCDVSLRKCMTMIREHLDKSDPSNRNLNITRHRSSILSENAAHLVRTFEKSEVLSCCDRLLLDEVQAGSRLEPEHYTLDGSFALETFIRACTEALNEPESPILDLGAIVSNGILALAITGLGSSNEEMRALSYACVELLSRLVGPVMGVEQGSSAGLYKNRRLLAFLLSLLRNSITEPMARVSPLFATWFRFVVNVALNSRHPSNGLITKYLLQRPVLNSSECPGAMHLIFSETSEQGLKATRILGLEVLRKGLLTRKDLIMCRRMKVFDAFYMLAGNHKAYDIQIRKAVFDAIHAILLREELLNCSEEFVSNRGLLPWLCQYPGDMTPTVEDLSGKLRIVDILSRNFANSQRRMYAPTLADGLRTLCEHVIERGSTKGLGTLVKLTIKCGVEIGKIEPSKRNVFPINFARLDEMYMDDHENDEVYDENLSKCLIRQYSCDVPIKAYDGALRRIVSIAERDRNREEDEAVHLSLLCQFVADFTLNTLKAGTETVLNKESLLLLTKAMFVHRSVWLLLSCIRVLHVKGVLSEKVAALAEYVPAQTRAEVDVEFEQRLEQKSDAAFEKVIDLMLKCLDGDNGEMVQRISTKTT